MTDSKNSIKSLPSPPFPTVGEIIYEIAVRSGLVQTTNDKDPLYNGLKAFKDDRKRPGLAPIEFPRSVLVDFEDRLAGFWNVEEDGYPGFNANMTLRAIRSLLEIYAGFVAARDATLIERDQMVEQVLWPSLFSAGASSLLKYFNDWKPSVNLDGLIGADNPFGYYLRFLCKNGSVDFNAICDYRANKNPNRTIDKENCRKTLEEWLNGKALPNLERCQEILIALKIENELSAKIWVLVARLLHKTPKQFRTLILNRIGADNPPNPQEQAYQLMKRIAWKIGSELNIGPDRPYAKIRTALYEPDPSQPRSRAHVIDMLTRQEKTWESIYNQTQCVIHWFWGRFHVLCGEYREGLERYKLAYDYGANRDPDIYNIAIHEAMVLAAVLGEKRQVERFRGWIGLYSSFDWDDTQESATERFEKVFPTVLRFPDSG